ncbi:MAG TPA: bifunctional chorismate mutase/prephenate dehydratase [Clostridiales bacterium]|nr:bifunctional chorismate mutase/prephenate dehydratase [Clostridiales bacterium]
MAKQNNQQIKIAYCGTQGSFSEQAAKRLFPEGKLIACATFQEAYDLALTAQADHALLPIENSYAGEVSATMDMIYRGTLLVNDLYEMRVVQNLVGVKGAKLSDVKTVISHPQALAQCAEYIAKHHLREVTAENTAFAAKAVSERGAADTAAIASKACAELYDLEVLAEDIAESRENTTRFALLSPHAPQKRKGERLILLFAVQDRSGALLEALKIIAAYGFNMKCLHSRPLKDKAWQYYFYVEAEGEGEEAMLLKDLSSYCTNAKIAGRYLPDQKLE